MNSDNKHLDNKQSDKRPLDNKQEDNRQSNKRNLLKAISFLTIVLILFWGGTIVSTPNDPIQEQNVLYAEEIEDSIDIAFIGSSSTYRFYDVMAVWEEYQITSMCYFIASMPYDFITSMIEVASERQDPEVYVIDLRHIITDEYKEQYFGYYESETQKAAFINSLNLITNPIDKWTTILEHAYTQDDGYVYGLSLLYNHENFVEGISSWISNGFTNEALPYKGNYISYSVADLTDTYEDFSDVEEDLEYTLTESTQSRLLELFDYCEENDINAYFTITPYVHSKCYNDQDIRREIGEFVIENGYPFTDYRAEFEEIELDPATDFYDKTHANALGAKKYTLYAMEDILEVYEIEPDYEQEIVDSWNAAFEEWELYDTENLQILFRKIIKMKLEL